DCVEIDFTNDASGGAYGVHIDGLSFDISSSGDSIGLNTSSAVPRGESRSYRYYVPNEPTLEGAHYLHPGPGYRQAVSHGLFGALVVEPKGSTYLHPETRAPIRSGWEAIIDAPGSACEDPGGRCDFREAVQLWHEVGNEQFRVVNRRGGELPMLDEEISGAYGPARRAINYRSEPFFDRMLPTQFRDEKSHTYSSYTFGDPTTTIPRSYLGDPMKWRLMHVGTEMFHVFHLHGGGIRWRQNPEADPTFDYSDTGLDKDPPTKQSPSNRLDSQAIGPGESFNLEIEGGAGGVQQSAGDFLFHCHIAHHYFAGMWSFWRTFDTLQRDLAPLPDRAPLPAAVDSSELIGRTMPDGTTLTAGNLDEWIEPQLPPRGVRRSDQDGAVWNWTVNRDSGAPVYLGEPEDAGPWPLPNGGSGTWPNIVEGVEGHPGSMPADEFIGNRPHILFNPSNGRPAYPLLRPHIGMRPPFSPNGHSGAPWLGERAGVASGDEVNPWADRPDGLCPAGAQERDFDIVSIRKGSPITDTASDPNASVFTLAEDKTGVLAGRKPVEPLAIRANMRDCVTGTYTTELPGGGASFTKSNLHIHHVQFDVQASDGVVSGLAFEQSVRPYRLEDPTLTAAADAGTRVLRLSNIPAGASVGAGGAVGQKFQPGVWIGVGLGTEDIEVAQIESINGNTVTLAQPLESFHEAGQWAGTEFTQFRWFPDVGLDNIFWHDHVDGIDGWGHGLVGQLIIEPPGSTYHDPVTGEEVRSGNIVDIRTEGSAFPGVVEGSFRELALWTIDDNPVADSTLNLRAEPWSGRAADTSARFSSYMHGDPSTPLPRAYPGDPVVIRTINVGPSVDTLHVDGHRFFIEGRYLDELGKPEASPTDTLHYGVSEKYSLALEGGAGGPNHEPGDYLYMNGIGRRFRQGAWGIIRVLEGADPELKPLPG
ncbi:MAG: multicopper oxidase domain-containing protein, partial [Actinomycetota bacterium]